MKKINIIKKNYDFEKIIKTNKVVRSKYFVLYYKENDNKNYRFGISVGKKLGNAVLRNKYKRRLRSIIDNNQKLYEKDLDYIIILREPSLNLTFLELNERFIEIINKQRGLNEK